MAFSSFFFLFAVFSLSIFHVESLKTNGFSVDLIHRDSLKSPFYNPSKTHSARVLGALERSLQRVHRFRGTDDTVSPHAVEADIVLATGEYLMSISVGTPPFSILAIADTSNNLIWTQCKPCTECFQQKYPLFDPRRSSSYQIVDCRSAECAIADGEADGCGDYDDFCRYDARYGESESLKSYSKGIVAFETLTLGSTNASNSIQIPKALFGCGFENSRTFHGVESGVIGLGYGNASLISQMKSTINGKFSYCLVPLYATADNYTSKINFGSNSGFSGRGVVSTPLVLYNISSFYYLTIEAISVGDERVEFYEYNYGYARNPGNTVIDTGTTLTFLPQDFYDRLRTAVVDRVRGATEITIPGKSLDLCYDSVDDLAVPDITVHFKGADVKLHMYNAFVRFSDNVVCFAFAPGEITIYGTLAQMNFLVGYDTQKRTVSFKAADCTKN